MGLAGAAPARTSGWRWRKSFHFDLEGFSLDCYLNRRVGEVAHLDGVPMVTDFYPQVS